MADTQEKRKPGRPRIPARIDYYSNNRRLELNKMYMYEATGFLEQAGDRIPDREVLWRVDPKTRSAYAKDGVLEQLGRMLVQDHNAVGDCVTIANYAIDALKAGCTSRQVEVAIRNVRKPLKKVIANPDDEGANCRLDQAVEALKNLAR